MTNPDIEAAQIPDNASFPREIVENGITWKLLGAKYGTPQDIRMTMETYVQPVDDHPTPAQAQGERGKALEALDKLYTHSTPTGISQTNFNALFNQVQAALSHAPEVESVTVEEIISDITSDMYVCIERIRADEILKYITDRNYTIIKRTE